MEKAEEVFHFLEEFSKRKPKIIPQELDEYLAYVARTGDPVYPWGLIKCLFKEKLLNVISDFYETSPGIDIPPYPNVDPFNYDIMKNSLLERLDSFTAAPFTVQRICELLTYPRKQYNRIDKYMRAVEKNILVVSTREPGLLRQPDIENGEPVEPILNGSDNNSEYNVDVEMEDMSWKENREHQNSEPQPSSSEVHISVDDIEARLQAKQEVAMEISEKVTTEYESVTPPEPNIITSEEQTMDDKPSNIQIENASSIEENKMENVVEKTLTEVTIETKIEDEIKPVDDIKLHTQLIIPEIKVDDAEMTEQKLTLQAAITDSDVQKTEEIKTEKPIVETKAEIVEEVQNVIIDESSSDANKKDEIETIDAKVISEVSTSSEESSSSSDNTDGNSNSPKTDSDSQNQDESNPDPFAKHPLEEKAEEFKEIITENVPELIQDKGDNVTDTVKETEIKSENYSISDVNSEIKTLSPEPKVPVESSNEDKKPETPEQLAEAPVPPVADAVASEEEKNIQESSV